MRTVTLTLRGRLLLGAILPALLMVILLETVFLGRYQVDLEQAFQERGQAVARQLGPAVEFALFSGNEDALQVLVDTTRRNDAQIVGLAVLDTAGKLLRHSGDQPEVPATLHGVLQVTHYPDRMQVVAPVRQTELFVETDLVEQVSAARASDTLGYVAVEFSRASLNERKREMIQITLLILLGGLLLASWLSLRIASGVLGELEQARNELQRQKDAAEALARTDALTGLANRRAFDETAHSEIQRAVRYGTPLSLVMTDIDFFKAVNDTHGHHVGDLVLKDFAQILLASLRNVDLVGRWGGEEFTILMPGTDLAEAQLVAERMRLAVAGAPTRFEGKAVGYTASFGVAELLPASPTMDALLGRADAALYRAKANGRNRVETG